MYLHSKVFFSENELNKWMQENGVKIVNVNCYEEFITVMYKAS